MDRARIVRQVGEVLSSHAALRDAWPTCLRALASLVDADGAQIVADEADETAVVAVNGAFTVTVPLRFDRERLGTVRLDRARTVDDESLALLEACAFTIGSRMHFERFTQSSERLAELARIDALTGIANRRRFDETFESAFARAQTHATPLSLAVIDIDYFKAYNDTYGHQAGDACLRSIARALEACTRRTDDLLARYGGEEFVVLLPDASLAAAIAACESACEAIASLNIAHAGSALERVSISAGVATLSAQSDARELFREADDALYHAKRAGRNRIAAAGYVSMNPPAERILPSGGTNLPEPPTKLIGRVRDLRDLAVRIPQHRLTTITGIGGGGKTRVAIEAASHALPHFEDGVWFVDFSAVASETLVASAVSALFAGTHDGTAQELLGAIGRKHALLVLDNCETMLHAVATLAADILQVCPRMHILATSREPLGVDGEVLVPLAPLAPHDAVELFVARLRDASPGFALDAERSALAESICRRLDGIPLALELAAPRAAAVGLERLENDLERHPTIRSVIAWSCALLSDHEARVFRRLAIFTGGFRTDAAVDVCWDAEVSQSDIAGILERLARKSFIVVDVSANARMRMLETIREYALEQLATHDELDDVRRRHAEWALVFARDERNGGTPPGRSWLALMTAELDNFRAAIAWALIDGADVNLGYRLTAALMTFLHDVAPAEGTRWALRARGVLREQSDPAFEAEICFKLASMRSAPAPQLRDAAERAVEIYRASGDRAGLGKSLRTLAQTIGWYFRSERALADELACEAIDIARSVGDPLELVVALRVRGLTIDISDFPAKRAALEEALALARQHRMDRLLGTTLTWISELEFSAGQRRRAYEYGSEALHLAEASGSRELYATAVLNFASYAAAVGEFDNARDAALRGLRVGRSSAQDSAITYSLQALAIVAASRGELERAARLIGFCDARDGVLHPPRQADQSEDIMHRALLMKLRRDLGNVRFEEFAEAGRALVEDKAVEEAVAAC